MRTVKRLSPVLLFLVMMLTSSRIAEAQSAGVVGTGSPASCTEAALHSAMSDGGSVTFNCGGVPVDIVLSAQMNLALDTQIDGGALVNYGDLTIINNTGGNGGAVYPRWAGSHTHIVNSILRQNHAVNATGWGGRCGESTRWSRWTAVTGPQSPTGR